MGTVSDRIKYISISHGHLVMRLWQIARSKMAMVDIQAGISEFATLLINFFVL